MYVVKYVARKEFAEHLYRALLCKQKAGCILLRPGYPFTPFPSVLKACGFSHAGSERAWRDKL